MDGTQRGKTLAYQVPTKDAADLVMNVPALAVRQSVRDCDLTTVFEWFNANWVSADGATKGRWEERRTNLESERLIVNIEDPAVMNTQVNIRQQYYMKEMKSIFGEPTFDGIPDEMKVKVRYCTYDPASSSSKAKVCDPIDITFTSSGETIVDYCSDEYNTLSVEGGSEFTSALTYTVTTEDGTAARQTYDITTVLLGWDAMSYECSSQIYRTVEYQVGGKFRTIYDSREQVDSTKLPFLYINDENQITFGLTQKEYEKEVQFMFETSGSSQTAPAQIVYRDASGGEVGSGLTQSFDFIMQGNGQTSSCADASLTYESAAYDEYLAFHPDHDWKDLEVYHGLVAKSDTLGCNPVYKLYALSPYASPNDGWMPWEDLVDVMKTKLSSGKFQSWVKFNVDTGDLMTTFYKPDVNELRADFTDNGVTSIDFKVRAALPGSNGDGPDQLGSGSLPEAQFKVVILDADQVEDCTYHKFTIGSRTVNSDSQRPEKYVYQIANKDVAGTPVVIEAYNVKTSIAGCIIESRFEWKDNRDGTWKELTSNSFVNIDFASDKMLVNFNGSNLQENYLSEWVNIFGSANAVGTPDKLEVEARFVHRDASHNKWDTTSPVKYDTVKLEIKSSLEDPAVYCDDLAALTIKSGTEVSGETYSFDIATATGAAEFDFGAVVDTAQYNKLKEICQ
jgi:hypothetical protein